MLEFHAKAVEVLAQDEGILSVHFDDRDAHYLQLQSSKNDGGVYVEVDSQLFSGFDCIATAELRRRQFSLVFTRNDLLEKRIGEVVATFDIEDVAFAELRKSLALTLRSLQGFRIAEDADPG